MAGVAQEPIEGQRRGRPIAETLRLARIAGERAQVVRLADVTGLDRLGVPVFQAVRPASRSLSVSQGKGLTPRAAMISALLEACEFDLCERVAPIGPLVPLHALGAPAQALWCDRPRAPGCHMLDPTLPRRWLAGRELAGGAAVPIPWDLVSLDFTWPALPDAASSSDGTAIGNSLAEAEAAALAELIERAATAHWHALGARAARAFELDLDSVDAPLPRKLLRRFAARGCRPLVWSVGEPFGVPAFRCVLIDLRPTPDSLPPAEGSGCHPDRGIALTRALIEAAQVRVTLIAGARDDFAPDDYGRGDERSIAATLATLSIGAGPFAWTSVPQLDSSDIVTDRAILIAAAARASPLPVLAYDLPSPAEGLSAVKLIAPGLPIVDAAPATPPSSERPPLAPAAASRRRARIVVFAGPSVAGVPLPPGIDLRQPAICGDLAALLHHPPDAVGLIDGCFELAPTVWHKEIMGLLACGTRVFGAASLGAVRAAELDRFGMIGVGRVYAAYRDGAVVRDDAVMVSHAPPELGYAALTVALVDAETALERVRMPRADRRMLQRIVRTCDFRSRTWVHCLTLFEQRTGRPAPAGEARLAQAASLKREDAELLLATIAETPRRGSPLTAPPPATCFYQNLLTRSLPASTASGS